VSQERRPLGSFLEHSESEEALQRVWRNVQRRRAQKSVGWVPVLVALVALSGLVLTSVLVFSNTKDATGALRDNTGRAPSLMQSGAPRTTTLSDGSRVEIGADSALEVLENDGDAFVCALRQGKATFDVVPGGPRRWRIEAGIVTIEVVGTRFLVDRKAGAVTVEVERGAVLVRGQSVRDGVQKLSAGARLEVVPPPVASSEVPSPPPAAVVPKSAASALGGPGVESRGAPSAESATTDFLAIADRQRREGDLKGAIQTLKLAMERDSDGTRGAIAAFTLGKLLLDGVGQPVEAQAAFRACLKRSPPSAVAEDALARLVEAQSRSGARDAARASAQEYERRYPNGPRLSDVRRWAGIE
jgi:transmembrane sensor